MVAKKRRTILQEQHDNVFLLGSNPGLDHPEDRSPQVIQRQAHPGRTRHQAVGIFPTPAKEIARDDNDVSNVHSKFTYSAGLSQGMSGRN